MSLPASVLKDTRKMYRRLKAMGDYYASIAEAERKAGVTTPSQAARMALQCWKEALAIAYRLGGLSDERPPVQADPHDELAARRHSRAPD